jgi:hypothetical protein
MPVGINICQYFWPYSLKCYRRPLYLSNLKSVLALEVIQKICDSLGGTGGGGVSKNVTRQFLFVISLVKVDKKCHMGVVKSAEKVSRII